MTHPHVLHQKATAERDVRINATCGYCRKLPGERCRTHFVARITALQELLDDFRDWVCSGVRDPEEHKAFMVRINAELADYHPPHECGADAEERMFFNCTECGIEVHARLVDGATPGRTRLCFECWKRLDARRQRTEPAPSDVQRTEQDK